MFGFELMTAFGTGRGLSNLVIQNMCRHQLFSQAAELSKHGTADLLPCCITFLNLPFQWGVCMCVRAYTQAPLTLPLAFLHKTQLREGAAMYLWQAAVSHRYKVVHSSQL